MKPLTSLRPGKHWIVLGIALVVGLLAALAARSYLAGQMAEIEARSRGQTIKVVVARHDLKKGDRLAEANMLGRAVPAQYVHSTAIHEVQYERLVGLVLTHDVRGGDLILPGLLAGAKTPTFSARVVSGHRAMTVPVDEINSISGMLEPGDLIDLLVTIDQKGRKNTFPLLQRVTVMATGQRSVDDPRSGERRTYSTVTLDTDVQQAQNIIVAREAGKLTALLRNPEDKGVIDGGAVDLAALLGNGTSRGDGEVPVLYGGRGAKLPPEGLRLGRYVVPGKVATPSMPGLGEVYDAATSKARVFSAGSANPSRDESEGGRP